MPRQPYTLLDGFQDDRPTWEQDAQVPRELWDAKWWQNEGQTALWWKGEVHSNMACTPEPGFLVLPYYKPD